jgi:hypothetical protein
VDAPQHRQQVRDDAWRSTARGSTMRRRAERKQLAGERSGALAAFELSDFITVVVVLERPRIVRVAGNRDEQIVEIVRNAAGQRPMASIFCSRRGGSRACAAR